MDTHRIIYLYRRQRDRTITTAEQDELDLLLADARAEEVLKAHWDEQWDTLTEEQQAALFIKNYEQIYSHIVAHPQARQPVRRLWARVAVAASLVIVVGTALLYLLLRQAALPAGELSAVNDIAPGGNRASLTLADGYTIDLSEAQSGIIVGDEITYLDGSTVLGNGQQPTADRPANGKEGQASRVSRLMLLATPKGGTYQITLPDGTTVWLNAASTLKYPSHFSDGERVVELEGEAYFDVSEQWSVAGDRSLRTNNGARVPFKVITNGQTVEVLGTQFNISAYPDENETKTTLVAGSVRVTPTTNHPSPIIIAPGQQSTMRGAVIDVANVDTEPYTAWKDGLIVLNSVDVSSVIRQLERWYDITFDVSDWPEGLRLEGELPRDTKLSGILEALKLNTGKQLYIEGRRVMERR